MKYSHFVGPEWSHFSSFPTFSVIFRLIYFSSVPQSFHRILFFLLEYFVPYSHLLKSYGAFRPQPKSVAWVPDANQYQDSILWRFAPFLKHFSCVILIYLNLLFPKRLQFLSVSNHFIHFYVSLMRCRYSKIGWKHENCIGLHYRW